MRLQLKKLPKIVQGYAWLRVALVKNNITYSPWCIPHLKVPTCCRACRERERQQKLFRKCCAREQYENSATRRQPGRTFVSKTWLKLNISPRACRKQFNWRWATERSVVNRTSDRRSKLVKICEKKEESEASSCTLICKHLCKQQKCNKNNRKLLEKQAEKLAWKTIENAAVAGR